MTEKELKQILENHKHWLQKDCDGWERMKADLRYANLRDVDLSGADLRYADLSNVNLNNADLSCANLRYADLNNADLSNADLRYANLSNADLSNADLSNANIRDANLRYADLNNADLSNADLSYASLRHVDLRYADLRYVNLNKANLRDVDLSNADLRCANLSGADLKGADLSGANLRYANLRDVDLSNTKNIPYVPMICPEEGDFIGWKNANGKIVKLHITEDALRSSATTRKCRCNKAEVVEIYNLDGTISEQRCVKSDWDKSFVYQVGETVSVDNFDKDRWHECSYGIHFFINRQEAVEYGLS